MTRFRISLFAVMTAAALLLAAPGGPAAAQSLDELRAAGKVGESYTGLAVARDPSVADFVEEVNAKRQAIYAEQAQKTGASVADVGAVYAREIVGRLPAGTWVLTDKEEWVQQ